MHVAIRVDAGQVIGTGHLARCTALALELKQRGLHIYFICRNLPGADFSNLGKDFPLTTLPAPPNYNQDRSQWKGRKLYASWLGVDQKTDAEQTASALLALRPQGFDWIIVDHYGLSAEWERELRGSTKHILMIDDLADRPLTSDLVVNQNLLAGGADAYKSWIGEDTSVLQGPTFALLRSEFREARNRLPKVPSTPTTTKIFVGFGGVDADGDTVKACQALGSIADLEILAVVGNAFQDSDAMAAERKKNPRLEVFQGIRNVAELMSSCQLAVGGGGTMSWERACMGLPSVVISISENQEPIAQALANAGGCLYLGRNASDYGESLKATVSNLLGNASLSLKMRERALSLVDGLGTIRVAEQMEKILG